MTEQRDEIERMIMTSYRLMKDYRELDEPELVSFHEKRMNDGLVQWDDLRKFIGGVSMELTEADSTSTI